MPEPILVEMKAELRRLVELERLAVLVQRAMPEQPAELQRALLLAWAIRTHIGVKYVCFFTERVF